MRKQIPAPARPRVVIVGGGFGGLYAAQQLGTAAVDVTLIDRRNFHLFQPLLYQVATGGLSPADISSPLRAVLNRQRNTRVLQAEVVDFDLDRRRVILRDGEVPYDTLIVAAGATSHYFGNPEWEGSAPGLKTVQDALEIRRKVFIAFEAAERETDPAARAAWLTFVVVGGGPTGVELAGALGELARHTLKHDFRSFDPASARVLLLEGGPRILPAYPDSLSEAAASSLAALGVEVRTGVQVTGIEADGVRVRAGETEERLPARTVLWAAGMKASPLGAALARRAGAELDRTGRVVVEPDLTLPGHPEVYVIGDLAHFAHGVERPLPGVAPVAIQQGRFVGRRLRRGAGAGPDRFRYQDKGSLAVIGRNAAVAAIGRWRVRGFFAWLLWMFIHILYLVEFENRMLVLTQWALSYFTRKRGARLITPEVPVDLTSDVAAPAEAEAGALRS
ncbi:MAG: NAD(P)/FAD-dependent oxidoreductase [Armatimonadota bacterium]